MSVYTTLLRQEVGSERGKHYLQRVAAGVAQIDLRADALLYFANLRTCRSSARRLTCAR